MWSVGSLFPTTARSTRPSSIRLGRPGAGARTNSSTTTAFRWMRRCLPRRVSGATRARGRGSKSTTMGLSHWRSAAARHRSGPTWDNRGSPCRCPARAVRDETLVAYAPEVREALARRGQPVAGSKGADQVSRPRSATTRCRSPVRSRPAEQHPPRSLGEPLPAAVVEKGVVALRTRQVPGAGRRPEPGLDPEELPGPVELALVVEAASFVLQDQHVPRGNVSSTRRTCRR